jgi:hypothetical protein
VTLLKACAVCGRPSRESRCPLHPRPVAQRNQRLRAVVATSASVCPVWERSVLRLWFTPCSWRSIELPSW